MPATPIDLKALYGATYHIVMDDSAKIPGQTADERLWLYRIRCRGNSHIFVHGVNTLGAYCGRQRVRLKLKALPGVTVHQEGDEELSVTFPPEVLPAVADLLEAKRRVHLTPEQKEVAVARIAKFRYPGKVSAPAPGDTDDFDLREAQERSAETGTVDPSSDDADRS